MANFIVFTRPDAPKFAKLAMFLFDLPVRGQHGGGGIHVPMPDVAPNPCPKSLIGWVTRGVRWISKPTNVGPPPPAPGPASDEYAVRITAQIQDLWQAKKSQLSQAQRNFFQPFIDAAAPLGPEWLRSTTGPDGQPTMALFEDDDVEPEP